MERPHDTSFIKTRLIAAAADFHAKANKSVRKSSPQDATTVTHTSISGGKTIVVPRIGKTL
jgi:hypothetical protein